MQKLTLLWALLAFAFVACVALSVFGSHQWQCDTEAERTRVAALRAQQAVALRPADAAAPATKDFVARLPATASTEQLLRDASAWAASSSNNTAGGGLRLLSASSQPSPASATLLARSDLSLQVQGSYPAMKGWLRELLARYPSLALLGMDLRRDDSPAGERVQATLRPHLYAQP